MQVCPVPFGLGGGEHVLHLLGEGDTFNDIAALDRGRNPAKAAALGDVTLWFLPSEALEAASLEDRDLALRVIRVLAARVRYLVVDGPDAPEIFHEGPGGG